MADKTPGELSAQKAKKDRRDARLAAELRANLKRRKAAARDKPTPAGTTENPEKSEP